MGDEPTLLARPGEQAAPVENLDAGIGRAGAILRGEHGGPLRLDARGAQSFDFRGMSLRLPALRWKLQPAATQRNTFQSSIPFPLSPDFIASKPF